MSENKGPSIQPRPEFDNFADHYDELLTDPIRDRFAGNSRFFHQAKLEILLSHLRQMANQPKAMHWLDVGCGTGELLQLGKDSFLRFCGCDVSGESLKYCAGITVKVQDAPESIPFADQSFDLVTAACVFHHVEPDRRSMLMESMVRVLRPGGIISVFEHNPWNPVTRTIVKRSPVDVNAILLSSRECSGLLAGVGMTILAKSYYLFFPESLEWMRRNLEPCLRPLPLGGQYVVLGSKSGT